MIEEIIDDIDIFISGNTPSSKNNQIWVKAGYIVASKATQKWRKATKPEWIGKKELFLNQIANLPQPYYVEFTFHRYSRRLFDYINAAQAVQDAMSNYKWIEDDNCCIIKPYFGDYVHNKEKPGVYIKILKEKPIHDLPLNEIRRLILSVRDDIRGNNLDNALVDLKQIFNFLNR